jgi:hypothetical protein
MRHVTTLGDSKEGGKEGTMKFPWQPKFKPLASEGAEE